MNQELVQEESPVEVETPSLTVHDRCDQCGSQAYVLVTFTSGSLLFCAHHWTKVRDKAEPLSILLQDETHKLLLR